MDDLKLGISVSNHDLELCLELYTSLWHFVKCMNIQICE